MALKSQVVEIATTDTEIFEMDAGLNGAVLLTVGNVTSSERTFTLKFYKQSLDQTTIIVSGYKVTANELLQVPIKFTMEEGDKIIMSASNASSLSAFCTIYDTDQLTTGRLEPKGEYDSEVIYSKYDFVRVEADGRSYISMQDNNVGNAPDPDGSTEYWMRWLKDGEEGAPGELTKSALFGYVDPTAAAESSGDITLDVDDGAVLSFTHTMAGAETLQIPANMPDGATIDLLIDPDGNTLSYASGYEGVNDELPDIDSETLLVIKRSGSRYFVLVAGSGFGDGT